MKKVIKNGLFAILFVLLTLCIVSCSPLTGNKGDNGNSNDNGSGTDAGKDGSGDTEVNIVINDASSTYTCSLANGDGYTFMIMPSGKGFMITMKYYKKDNAFEYGYFSEVKLDGAAKGMSTLLPGNGVFQALLTVGSKSELLQDYLPTTDTWTIIYSSSEDSSRNVSHTIASEYVTKIKAWIDER